MATSAVYVLREMDERSTDEDSGTSLDSFPVAGRVNWDLELRLLRIESGASLEVAVEAAPVDEADQYSEVSNFGGAKTDADIPGSSPFEAQVTLEEGENYLRARVKQLDGDAIFEVKASSAFLAADDANINSYVRKAVESYSQGKTRLIEEAEEMILTKVLGQDHRGWLRKTSSRVNSPLFLEIMKRAVGRQAEHLFQREQLQKSREASALVTLRQMPEIAPSVEEGLDLALPEAASSPVWHGR